jgi:hypothetical protein
MVRPSQERRFQSEAEAGLRRSCVMSVSSESDPEGGQGSAWVAGVVAQGGGEVDRPGPAERSKGEVAQAGHDLRAGPGSQLRVVLCEGRIPHPVQAVLDRPVPPEVVGEAGGAGLGVGEASDRMDRHGPPPSGAKLAGGAGDLEDLGACGKPKRPTVTALRVRSSTRPCVRSRVRSATGTFCRGWPRSGPAAWAGWP